MATIKDIADFLNISPSTVSRALNNSELISLEVRQRVFQAAQTLGYTLKARNRMYSADRRLAGIIVPDYTAEYYMKILKIAEEQLSLKGLHPIVQTSSYNSSKLIQAFSVFEQIGVSCMLLVTDIEENIGADVLCALSRSNIPTVLVAPADSSIINFDCIDFDEKLGISLALRHLTSKGYQKIGFIGTVAISKRYELFCQAMRENGLKLNPEFVAIGEEGYDTGGYLRMKELLSRKERPDAILAGYDILTFGVIRALQEAGLSIPQDMAVVGFDNIAATNYFSNGITTISFSSEEMVQIAITLLAKRLSSPNAVVQKVSLQPQLIIRSTT